MRLVQVEGEPVHAVDPPHYGAKAEIERTSLLQVG